jgi:hypothetical protein
VSCKASKLIIVSALSVLLFSNDDVSDLDQKASISSFDVRNLSYLTHVRVLDFAFFFSASNLCWLSICALSSRTAIEQLKNLLVARSKKVIAVTGIYIQSVVGGTINAILFCPIVQFIGGYIFCKNRLPNPKNLV